MTLYFLDIDECRYSRCDQICTNLEGSYKCDCRDGYYLDRDGRICLGINLVSLLTIYHMSYLDVNECGSNNGGCAHKCINTAGSHRCECPNGETGCYKGEHLCQLCMGVSCMVYIIQ